MASTNAIIHIVAVLGILGLGWAFLKIQKQKEFILSLLRHKASGQQKVLVDWPLRFVKKFAKAFAIPCDGLVSLPAEKPQRIKGWVLGQLFTQEGIAYIRYHEATSEDQEAWLEVGVINQATAVEQWGQALREALQLQTRVVSRQ